MSASLIVPVRQRSAYRPPGSGGYDVDAVLYTQTGKRAARHSFKIAVVESHDASAEGVDFLESVAHNRGGAIEFFDELDVARDWLGVSGR